MTATDYARNSGVRKLHALNLLPEYTLHLSSVSASKKLFKLELIFLATLGHQRVMVRIVEIRSCVL